MAPQWLSCLAPGVIGSVLGLVGQVSVYCDWVRWKVWSATSISVWQHVKLSEQIRPRDTLACCWDVKQPTNKTNPLHFTLAGFSYALPGYPVDPKPVTSASYRVTPCSCRWLNFFSFDRFIARCRSQIPAGYQAQPAEPRGQLSVCNLVGRLFLESHCIPVGWFCTQRPPRWPSG